MSKSAHEPLPEALALALKHLRVLEDPRIARTRLHPLENVLVMSLCGVLCGADGWDDLEDFADAKRSFFEGLLDMPHGVPSADTFRRVLSAIEPTQFEACFRAWVGELAGSVEGQVVALDGKAVKGAVRRAFGKTPLHLLHAWASEQQLLLGQTPVEGAPGEVAALPKLIRLLQLQGACVTADANGCTREVAEACVEKGADYVLALKGNRGALHAHTKALFEALLTLATAPHFSQEEVHHGRREVRRAWALPLEAWPIKGERWRGARSVVCVERERTVDGKLASERHHYLTSLAPDAPRLATIIRSHWGVENGLHWVLDVAFDEDGRKIRDRTGAENFALLSRMALLMLKHETSTRAGIARKRKKAGWDDAYLLRLLFSGLPKN